MWILSPMFLSVLINFMWKTCYFLACLTRFHFIYYRNEHAKNCCVVGLLSGLLFVLLSFSRPESMCTLSSAVTGTPPMVLPQSCSERWWILSTSASTPHKLPQGALRVLLRVSFLPWFASLDSTPTKNCFNKSRFASFEHHPGEQSSPDKGKDPPTGATQSRARTALSLDWECTTGQFANAVFLQRFSSNFQSQRENTRWCGRKIRGMEGNVVSLYHRNKFFNS